jgi:hypothetical protein
MISAVASVMTLYSASVLDRDTDFCFLEHHEIGFGPRNIANTHEDFLSSLQPAQSASEKALTIMNGDDGM